MMRTMDWLLWRYRTHRERLLFKLVWMVPKRVVYFCTIRAVAEATSGDYGADCPSDVSVMDMLKRCEGWCP